jgi:hypothetical protein
MKTTPPAFLKNLYYGWVIVAVALVSMGFWFVLRSIFRFSMSPWLDEFHWSRGRFGPEFSPWPDHLHGHGPRGGGSDRCFGPRGLSVRAYWCCGRSIFFAQVGKFDSILCIFTGWVASTGLTTIAHNFLLGPFWLIV